MSAIWPYKTRGEKAEKKKKMKKKKHGSCGCCESDVYSGLTEGHLLLHTTITEIPELQWEPP